MRAWIIAGGLGLAALIVLLIVLARSLGGGAGDWAAFAPGVSHQSVGLPEGATGEAFRVDLGRAEIRVVDARDEGGRALARTLRERVPGAVLAMNGGFFDAKGTPMGLVLASGRVTNTLRRADWGVFWVAAGRAGIVHTRTWHGAPRPDVRHALQAGPRLVVGGRAMKLKPQVARRTVVCLRSPTEVVLLTTEAVGAQDLAEWLAAPPRRGGLGCLDALNLDGGPSTQLSAESGSRRVEVGGGWPVPTGLVVVPRADGGG